MIIETFLLVSSLSGWFGPSTQAECETTYAVPAQTRAMGGEAIRQCQVLFTPDAHPVLKGFAQCVLDKIDSVKVDALYQKLREACAAANPDPTCPAHQTFDYTIDKCRWQCPTDAPWVAERQQCVWQCMPGTSGNATTLRCEPDAQPAPAPSAELQPGHAATSTAVFLDLSHEKSAPKKRKAPTCDYSSAMTDAEMAACR